MIPHFVQHPAGREIGIHQVAEILEKRETPVAAKPLLVEREFFPLGSEQGARIVQILLVVDLIPFLGGEPVDLQVLGFEQRDNPQYLLVILVFTQRLLIGLQERHVAVGGELAGQLIDVDGLIIVFDLAVVEIFLRNELDNIVFIVQGNDGSVHPCVVFSDNSQIGVGILNQVEYDFFFQDEVAFDQYRVILQQISLCQEEGVDIVGLIIDLISYITDLHSLVFAPHKFLDVFRLVSDHQYDQFLCFWGVSTVR